MINYAKLKHSISPAIALTLAGLGGAQAAQAAQAKSQPQSQTQAQPQAQAQTAQNPDNVLVLLWMKTNTRLLQDGKLKLSYRQSLEQIKGSTVAGPSQQDVAAEAAAKDALDRAALPLIISRLQANPGTPPPEAGIKAAFGKLASYLTIHSKNVATVAGNLDKARLADAATMFSIVTDLYQGGTVGGFDVKYGGGTRGMLNAVIDHYTGEEAGKVINGMGIDIVMRRGGTMLDTNAKKGVIKIPDMYLRQQQVQQFVAYGIRDFAAQIVIKEGPTGSSSYLAQPLPGAYNNPYIGTQGRNFKIGTARDVLLVKAAERLSALPPAPEPKAEAAKTAGKPAPDRPAAGHGKARPQAHQRR